MVRSASKWVMDMHQIPWKAYSEMEILEVLTLLFRERGHKVYNVHKTDRSGENGADLECSKTGETGKILIAVKKKPRKIDAGQLKIFAKRPASTKIYVHIEEPSTAFRKAMEEVKNHISFWNAEKLTCEVFSTDIRFYLFMVIENSFEIPIFEITRSFFKVYFSLKKKKAGKPIRADSKMLNLLWVAKDRSSSLHKALRILQSFFEETDLSGTDEETRRSIVEAFLKSLEELKFQSLDTLYDHLQEFLDKYPTNFEQYCEQTKGRSNWTYFAANIPKLSPKYIIENLERSFEFEAKHKDFLKKHEVHDNVTRDGLSYLLGDISRILANEVSMFEETVDDLFSIGIWGKWDDGRDEFARMSSERTKELEKCVEDELKAIRGEFAHNLDNKNFQRSVFPNEVFETYQEELSHRLSGNTFLAIQKAYQKVSILSYPSNLPDVNEGRHKEAIVFIDKAMAALTSNGELSDLRAEKRYLI